MVESCSPNFVEKLSQVAHLKVCGTEKTVDSDGIARIAAEVCCRVGEL